MDIAPREPLPLRGAIKYLVLASLGGVAMLFLDVPVAAWLHGHSFSRPTKLILSIFRVPGNYLFTLALAALLMVAKRCRLPAALVLLIAGAAASTTTALLKLCFGRSRPFHGREAFDWMPFACNPLDTIATRDLSFPSGDATLAFAAATVFAFIEPRLAKYAYAWAVLVGVIRVLQGAHYLSDVAAGGIVGMACAELMMRFNGSKRALSVGCADDGPLQL